MSNAHGSGISMQRKHWTTAAVCPITPTRQQMEPNLAPREGASRMTPMFHHGAWLWRRVALSLRQRSLMAKHGIYAEVGLLAHPRTCAQL